MSPTGCHRTFISSPHRSSPGSRSPRGSLPWRNTTERRSTGPKRAWNAARCLRKDPDQLEGARAKLMAEGQPPMIPARDALALLRDGNVVLSQTFAARTHYRAGPTHRIGRGPGAIRRDPRLLRFESARGDRLRSRPRRSVRHPRSRQYRRSVTNRQRRIRRGAIRHTTGGRPGPFAMRRHRSDTGAIRRPKENQSRNLRSIVDLVRPSVEDLLAMDLAA